MTKSNLMNSMWACCLLLAGACGGHTPTPQPQVAEPQGTADPVATEDDESEAEEEEVAEEEQPPPSGPAKLTVDAIVHGESKPAVVRVLDQDGKEIAKGTSGQAISLQSGNYDLVVSIEDEAVMIDRPTEHLSLTVEPGADLKQPVEFAWSNVQLNVRVNGKTASNAEVRLFKDDELVTTAKSGSDYFMITPGRYSAEVITGASTLKVNELFFPGEAKQSVPVDVSMHAR